MSNSPGTAKPLKREMSEKRDFDISMSSIIALKTQANQLLLKSNTYSLSSEYRLFDS